MVPPAPRHSATWPRGVGTLTGPFRDLLSPGASAFRLSPRASQAASGLFPTVLSPWVGGGGQGLGHHQRTAGRRLGSRQELPAEVSGERLCLHNLCGNSSHFQLRRGSPDNSSYHKDSSLDLQAYRVSGAGLNLNSLNLPKKNKSAVGQGNGAHFTGGRTEAPGVVFTCP